MNTPHVSAPISHDFASPDTLPPRIGRPLSCTPAKVTAICALIRTTGISDTAAGALAGVSRAALSRAKQDEEVETDLGQARAQYLVPRLAAIAETRLKDGRLDWRALAWLIKFASPEEYGPPSRRRRLEKVELPSEEPVVPPGTAPFVASQPSMADAFAAPRRAEESEAEQENVTFRSETPASSGRVGTVALEAGGGGAPAPLGAALGESVTNRSEIRSDAESDSGSEECSSKPERGASGSSEEMSSPVADAIPSIQRVSRRARRAEQRQQAREAWRAARQAQAA